MALPPPFETEVRSLEEFLSVFRTLQSPPLPLPEAGQSKWSVPGLCRVSGRETLFDMDEIYAVDTDNGKQYCWRERLVCQCCQMNNRQRAAIDLFLHVGKPSARSRIWLTEQGSRVYTLLRERFPQLVGSEFLGPDFVSGTVDARGLRHEDLMKSSFADGSLDFVLTYDVLEHMPDPDSALRECARILAPGGCLMFSVPFLPLSPTSVQRARLTSDGTIEHLLPPQYHGDPVHADQGVLCYYEYGWDILDRLKQAGFKEATAMLCESGEYGYYGGVHIMFKAVKAQSFFSRLFKR